MIVISGYICLLVCLLAVIGYLLHWYIYDELYVSVIVTMLIIIACLFVSGSAGFQSNMLPFNIDQMMGASGDQLYKCCYSVAYVWYFRFVFHSNTSSQILPKFVLFIDKSHNFKCYHYINCRQSLSLQALVRHHSSDH